jgi:hypothetical protein
VIIRYFVKAIFLSLIISILLVFNTLGQNLSDQKFSFKVVSVPLSEVLHILEVKTNFTFSYLNEKLPLDESVTIDVKDKPLQQILEIKKKQVKIKILRVSEHSGELFVIQ